MKLNVGFGSKTILESMNSYLKTEDYLKNKRIIDEEGLQSESGAMAANNIFYKLSVINKTYIKRGEINFINENYSKEEQRRIGNYKLGIKKDYSKQYRRPVLFE